jgi:hypothetical protein
VTLLDCIALERIFKRLLQDELGIAVTPNVLHFLQVKERRRQKRLAFIKTTEAKKNRMKRKYLELVESEAIAKRERAKRDGTYQTGQNVAEYTVDGYTLDELLQAATAKPKKNSRTSVVCPHCGLQGHSTTRSSKCLRHKSKRLQPDPTTSTVANSSEEVFQARAEDVNDHDNFPLQDDAASDSDSEAGFFDAQTWDSDDAEEDIDAVL